MRAIALVLVAGCGPPVASHSDYERVVWNAAMVPAPAGPKAVGPLPGADRISLAAGGTATFVESPYQSRAGGASGQVVNAAFANLRLGAGLSDWAELGVQGDWTMRDLAFPAATDLTRDDVGPMFSMRLGPGLRLETLSRRPLRFGGLGELEAGRVRWTRVSYETEETTVTTPDDDGTGVHSDTRVDGSSEIDEHGEIFWYVRTGPYLAWQAGVDSRLVGGFVVQTTPWFDGLAKQEWSCTTYVDGTTSGCEEPDAPPAYDTNTVLTVYMSYARRIGGAWLILQGHGNLADVYDDVRTAPFGGSLTIQVDFDPESREAEGTTASR